jgi:hypothetical protein
MAITAQQTAFLQFSIEMLVFVTLHFANAVFFVCWVYVIPLKQKQVVFANSQQAHLTMTRVKFALSCSFFATLANFVAVSSFAIFAP